MLITSSYSIKLKNINKVLIPTINIYRSALKFILDVLNIEYKKIEHLYTKEQVNAIEKLIHTTKDNTAIYKDFDVLFYKYPSYLRRSTIMDALGIYKSYYSNLKKWEITKQGKPPKLNTTHNKFPCFLKPNLFLKTDNPYVIKLKVFKNNDWNWIIIQLRKTDVDYINKYCYGLKESNPILERKGKCFYLRFSYETNVNINKESNLICAVDLGINNAATCCIMAPDGTVLALKFIKCTREEDQLKHYLNKIKKHQKLGSKENKTLWAKVNNFNKEIAIKTTREIIHFAKTNKANCIVFEHLDTKGKIKCSKKQRLHLWRKRNIQLRTIHNAHLLGMRVNRVCAYNTSKLAFDGSGIVKRNKTNFSLCKFSTGKQYHCDLNASYNIGARYYIKEKLKTLSAKKRLLMEAKVPSLSKRSTCTLATLKAILD